jgi:hypothetical protein
MTYHDYNCDCQDCDSSKWIYTGDVVKYVPGLTFNGAKMQNQVWYGLATRQGHDMTRVRWFDATYWMNANRWIRTTKLEKVNVK